MTQVLSGHGCFASFLHRIGKGNDPTCWHCDLAEDTADHTLGSCSAWSDERAELVEVLGTPDLTLESVLHLILERKENWSAFSKFCSRIMLRKENAERARERGDADLSDIAD
ncbi:PREDICTED: uncharacterized protein LOC105558761 [Vollenhovia emeryi]|uniref:uncharacterized protein LOC105558761 n=1 Tax=Vollenhovia emeryi TaxID=411798 RepID=UPI0005F3E4AE|nr:PREDICTED: uncharacterized protein LOC105558761 [Vollenhovia emeryi]